MITSAVDKNSDHRNRFGLTARDMTTIFDVLGNYPEIKTVVVFGSRAKGTYSSGSDIDLAIMDGGIDETVQIRLNEDFSESCLPYFVDLIFYADLDNVDLKGHIDRVGIPFCINSSGANRM